MERPSSPASKEWNEALTSGVWEEGARLKIRDEGALTRGEMVVAPRDRGAIAGMGGGLAAHVRALARVCPLAISAVTLDGIVEAWNPAAERLFGWSAEEVLGRPIPIMPGGTWENLLTILSQLSVSGGFGEHEGVRARKDGMRIEVSITTAPVTDEDGRIVGMFGIYQDIGERKRREAHQREQLSLLQAIVDGIPSPIFYKDARGAYLGCNAAFCVYVGENREDIIGKTVYDKWPKDLADVYDAADRKLLESRATQIYEAAVRFADGSRHDVIFHKGVFLKPDGAVGGQVGTLLDITDRKRVEVALRESEERYRAVISSLQEGILLKDRHGRTLAHNAAAERILGITGDEMLAHVGLFPSAEIVDESGRPFAPEALPIASTLDNGLPTSDVVAGITRGDGTRVWLSMNARALITPGDASPHAVAVSFSDVTERKLSQERLARHAYFDAVTNLPNRVSFHKQMEEQVRAASRGGGKFALLYMDLDGFKRVNDTMGHAAGDALLEVVAERFRGCVRDRDTVARLGGDEFTMILTGVEDPAKVSAIASRVLASIAAPITLMGQKVIVGVSIGCAMFPDDGVTVDALTRCADEAMYQSKQAGKNRLSFHSHAVASQTETRHTTENELRHAIEASELELYYQPKVQIGTRQLTGLEVLVRWNHPTRGLLTPAAFLTMAEERGLMVPITAWVLKRACEQSAAWLRAGRSPPRVAVNVSPRQVDDDVLVELVTRALAGSGLPPSLLEIEVTEDAVMTNKGASARGLSRLRGLGVTVAVDDFGTGYSSLSHLQQLPIDALKIDRSFVLGMKAEAKAKASTRPIVQAIVSMAHALELSVVAEGVETEEQLAVLAELGCEQAQGYYFGKPMPARELAERFLPQLEAPVIVVGAGLDPDPTILTTIEGSERVKRTSSLVPPIVPPLDAAE